jgi:type IV pilus assembly protein PilO
MDTKEPVRTKPGSAIVERIEQLVLWQRVAILVGLLIVLFGAATWLLYLPKYDEITELDQKLQALEKKLATAKINAAELEKFQAKMQEAEAQFKIAMRACPKRRKSLPSDQRVQVRSGRGPEFLLFEPKPENKKEFYAEIPVAMTIRGDYHNLAIFFDKVARLSCIVNINNININRARMPVT